MIRWTDFDGMAWECNIEDDGSPHTCGFNVFLGGGQGTDGLDLSSYKTINVDLDYFGHDQRLRFYLRNYEPGFSDINDIQAAKLAQETDKYKKLSMIDPLTGLLNRQGLSEYVEQYFPADKPRRRGAIAPFGQMISASAIRGWVVYNARSF